MKVLLLLMVTMVISSVSSFKIIHKTFSKLFDCQTRHKVPAEDWFTANLPESDATALDPNHQCAVYCQNEAFGLTTNGVLNAEPFLRFLPELRKKYDVEKIVKYCKYAGASNTCEGALKLNICLESYRPSKENYSSSILPKESYRPLPAKESYIPLPVEESYRPSTVTESYRPLPAKESYRPLPAKESYRPLPAEESYRPSTFTESYRPLSAKESYRPSTVTESYRPSTAKKSYGPLKAKESYKPITSRKL
uniref:Uncharacterized protein n=1 Tax=Glossina brevipalpis TaxID=37001 RepID=A0A1A9W9A2_9MUSC